MTKFVEVSVYPWKRYYSGMEQKTLKLRLRGTNGNDAGKWLLDIGLASKSGVPHRGALPFEDADLHPEKYFVSPRFIEEESSAWRAFTLEAALQHQRILKRAGFETQLA